jgi:hypothetical protein
VLFPIFVARLLRFLPRRLGADAVLAGEPATQIDRAAAPRAERV